MFLVPRTGKHLLFLLKRLKRSLRKLKLPRCNISPHLISEKRLWIPDEWVFAGSRPAVIDFYTTWCGPCKMMAPVVESLAGKYAGKIDFYKVDIDQESELASVFGISSIPTFLFIPVKGKPSVQMGAMQKEDFEGLIDKIKIK